MLIGLLYIKQQFRGKKFRKKAAWDVRNTQKSLKLAGRTPIFGRRPYNPSFYDSSNKMALKGLILIR